MLTPVGDVKAAIEDAVQFHQTLIITLHRTHSTATDEPYPMAMFVKIVDAVHASGWSVTTLSQLNAPTG